MGVEKQFDSPKVYGDQAALRVFVGPGFNGLEPDVKTVIDVRFSPIQDGELKVIEGLVAKDEAFERFVCPTERTSLWTRFWTDGSPTTEDAERGEKLTHALMAIRGLKLAYFTSVAGGKNREARIYR